MHLEANGLRFHVRDEGHGQPVPLLHGFPDSGRLWRRQVPALTAAGFSAVAPDLRGVGESDRPEGVDSDAMPLLVGDVSGMLDALGKGTTVMSLTQEPTHVWEVGEPVPLEIPEPCHEPPVPELEPARL